MTVENNNLEWLQNWYSAQCDGDWEHSHGICIGTLDNPGWSLSVDLVGTKWENRAFEKIKIERNENDWLHCFIREGKFEGPCGLYNLPEVLRIFREWVEG